MLQNPLIEPRANDYPEDEPDEPQAKLRVAHVDLTPTLRGGPRQMITLAKALRDLPAGADLEQIMVVRRNAKVAAACRAIDGIATRAVSNSVIAATRAARSAHIVHIHDNASIAVGALLSHRGTPFIVTRRSARVPKINLMTRWAYGRAARIIGVSERVSRVMSAYLNGASVGTIYDGVAGPSVVRSNRQDRDRRSNFVVGCVGTIEFNTGGQDLLLDAARKLLGSCPQVDIVFVGDGPDAGRLDELSQGLPNVIRVGWLDDVYTKYREMDALVEPARVEALGSTLLEAMSMSLPVVAADVGGIPEFVKNGMNGLLVPRNSAYSIAFAVARLANDDSLLRRLGAGARRTAARMNTRLMAEEYFSTYLNVLAFEQARHLSI